MIRGSFRAGRRAARPGQQNLGGQQTESKIDWKSTASTFFFLVVKNFFRYFLYKGATNFFLGPSNTWSERAPAHDTSDEVLSCNSDDDCDYSDYCSDNKCVAACLKCQGFFRTCFSHDNHQAFCQCPEGDCRDPCDETCGVNAQCENHGGVPFCSCPDDLVGNPFKECRSEGPCEPTPCGPYGVCEHVIAENPVKCNCLPGYTLNIYGKCEVHCESDDECEDDHVCSKNSCIDRCAKGLCGIGAICQTKRHTPSVACPKYRTGNPLRACDYRQ